MESYKFFNSAAGDPRTYQASDFAEYFASVLSTGLLHENLTPQLAVKASGTDLRTYVEPGEAIMKGHLYQNTENLYLTHSTANATMDRIDRVVLRLDERNEARFIKLFVVEGTPSTTPQAPALTRNSSVYELSLAQVRIRANTSTINPADVTDERLNSNVAGLVHSLISANIGRAADIAVEDPDNVFASSNAQGVLQELFTNADNAQKAFASVVGSPSAPGDTITKIKNDVQTAKNTLAANLTAKGATAAGTEALSALAAKVANVSTGASGTVTASTATASFQYANGTGTYNRPFVEVTGLDFKPSFILIEGKNGSSIYPTTLYSEQSVNDYPSVAKVTFYDGGTNGSDTYMFKADVLNAYVNDTGFKLPVSNGGISYRWKAYE